MRSERPFYDCDCLCAAMTRNEHNSRLFSESVQWHQRSRETELSFPRRKRLPSPLCLSQNCTSVRPEWADGPKETQRVLRCIAAARAPPFLSNRELPVRWAGSTKTSATAGWHRHHRVEDMMTVVDDSGKFRYGSFQAVEPSLDRRAAVVDHNDGNFLRQLALCPLCCLTALSGERTYLSWHNNEK